MKAAEITKVSEIPPAMIIGFTEALKQQLPNLDIVLILGDGQDAVASTTVSPKETVAIAKGIIEKMKLLFSGEPAETQH